MELKVLKRPFANDALVIVEGVENEMTEAGWTLGVNIDGSGNVYDFAWLDLAAGEYYDYYVASDFDADIVLYNAGRDYILELAEKFLQQEKSR